jgi:hypothetical protein
MPQRESIDGNNERRYQVVSISKWPRGERIALIALLVTAIAAAAGLLTVPELRRTIGLDSHQSDKRSLSTGPADWQKEETAERNEARIASEAESFSPMSITEYLAKWYAMTPLQQDQFEKDMHGKTIIWTGRIEWIKPGKNGSIDVTVNPTDGSYGTAFLDFDSSQRSDFLKLQEKQVIRFTGTIDSAWGPFLKACKLLQVIR